MHLKQCASSKEIFIVRNKNEILRQFPWKACAAISTCEATCQHWPGMGLDGMEAPGLYNSDKNPWQAYWHIAELLAYS